MQDDAKVQCPWCHEWLTLWVAVDEEGPLTLDCEVCCRPWLAHIQRDPEGRLHVTVVRE
jgi:hypothetical protein